MSCPFEIDVVRWVTGDTRLNELPRVEQHVAECAICRAKADSLRAMLSRLSDAAPVEAQTNESSPKVFVDTVMERIGREPATLPRRRARPLAFAVGLVLPLVLVGAWTIHRMNESGSAARGDASTLRASGVDTTLFVQRDGKAQLAETTSLRASDALVVRYDNPASKGRYFVALTLDADGNARWLYPSERAWLAKPGAIELRGGSNGQVPGDVVPLDETHGPVRVIAVVSDDAKGLEGARAALQGRPVQASVRMLFEGAAVREWLLEPENATPAAKP